MKRTEFDCCVEVDFLLKFRLWWNILLTKPLNLSKAVVFEGFKLQIELNKSVKIEN